MLSLAKIDETIGAKRQSLSKAVEAKSQSLSAVDTIVEAISALQSHETLTAEQEAELAGKFEALKTARAEVNRHVDAVHKHEAELDQLTQTREAIAEQHRQEANLRDAAPRHSLPNSSDAMNFRVQSTPLTDAEKDHDFASYFRAKFLSKRDMVPMSQILEGKGEYAELRNDRMLAVVNTSGSASVIPPNQVRDRLIELLTAATVMRRIPGIRKPPLLNGNLTLPRQATGSSAAYIGESTNIARSTPTTDSIALSEKKLAALVVQTGEILRRSSPSTDAMIRDDIVEQTSLAEDIQFIRGAGSATSPRGLKAFADATSATQVIAANATVNAANVLEDIRKIIRSLIVANTPMRAPAWVMHPQVKLFLEFLKNGNNDVYMFPEVERGLLRSFPIFTTTQIPVNLGGGTNATEVYLFDATEFYLADSPLMQLDMSDTAAYHDGSNVQAAFSRDEVVMRLLKGHDTQIRHPRSVAYLSGVLWGV